MNVIWVCFLLLSVPVMFLQASDQNQSNEMEGLLAFKHSSVDFDPKGFLNGWSSNSSSSPCSWWGVLCSTSGQVQALNFTNAGLIGHLHVSDLMALGNLRYLHFSGNLFSGDLSLDKYSTYPCIFETINLSFNNLSGTISESFSSSCDRLVSVNLSHNFISGGSFDFGASIQELDLSSNLISDASVLNYFFPSCLDVKQQNSKMLGKLGKLSSSCGNGSAAYYASNTVSSQESGNVSTVSSSNLRRSLTFLDVSHNNLSGDFSMLEFRNCDKLLVLNLSDNALFGFGIPESLTSCQFLQKLDISNNKLQGKTPAAFGKLRNLKRLALAQNNFTGKIPAELGSTCGNLQELDLSGNLLSGEFPTTFRSCNSLEILNLGNNQLSGNFLGTTISTLPNLRILQVPFNKIGGTIPVSLRNCTQLQVLDLSSNALIGEIPSELCIPSLEKLQLAGNSLSGAIPPSLGNCSKLTTIDFSFNKLKGSVPSDVWTLPNLSDLILWRNSLSGKIPNGICSRGSNKLERLILNNNFFSGAIPPSITNCTNLTWLSLSYNKLRGEIPRSIAKLQKLSILQLAHNSFSGNIPTEIGDCQSLIWLDLNNNRFTGQIPTELSKPKSLILKVNYESRYSYLGTESGQDCRPSINLLYIKGIRPDSLVRFLGSSLCSSARFFRGWIVQMLMINGSMVYLDLSFNNLSGSLPNSIGSMSYLSFLKLGHNRLTGTIPDMFTNLTILGVLDLSGNQLEGRIPGSLATLPSLIDVDLSHNNLSGPIPQTAVLTRFPASRFENNSGLCGYPLQDCASEFYWILVVIIMGFLSGAVNGISAADWMSSTLWFKNILLMIEA